MGKKLTEKFENGNIEEGYYYVWEDEFFDTIDFLFNDGTSENEGTIREVFKKVPDYYEYIQLKKEIRKLKKEKRYWEKIVKNLMQNKGE